VNELPEDFRDLLLLLLEHEAEFVIVGGHAVAFHGPWIRHKVSVTIPHVVEDACQSVSDMH